MIKATTLKPGRFSTASFRLRILLVAVCLLASGAVGQQPAGTQARGPLRVHPTNPRYFTDGTKNPDGSLRAVYLTGSHTWNNRLDIGRQDPPGAFDFNAYLDFLERHDHNFIRLWAWDSTLWDTRSALEWVNTGAIYHVAPQPWRRTGPGQALDGKPKFNLEQFDPAYFERLRARVQAAGRRGIYVSVMLFEGWALSFDPTSWRGHPFRMENNVQEINGDPDGDGKGREIQTLKIPAVTAAQEAYVRKVIDTVNDLDNVLYEISNEARLLNPATSTKDWQYHLIRLIKNEEAKKGRQHPVGMTSQGGGGGDDSEMLRQSPADWISPNSDKFDYMNNPPASDGGKVVLLDTDHLWGVGGDAAWVWKSFLRGHNPLFMDPYKNDILGKGRPDQWEGARQAMGATRALAGRIDLAKLTPTPDLASTKYCLAHPGREYLVYQSGTGEFSVNVTTGNYAFEWFDPTKSSVASTGSVKAPGGNRPFTPPFAGPAVLHLKRSDDSDAKAANPEQKPRTIRVAAAQAEGRVIDFRLSPSNALVALEKNLGELEEIIERAGREHCDVLVLPEDTPGLLHWTGANEAVAKDILPKAMKRLIERLGSAAARHRMYLVVCGDFTEDDGAIYNTAFLLGRDGREIGRYHKVCPTWAEAGKRQRGSSFPVFPTPDLGTTGMLICYDLVMPETARALALQGADIIFFPTMGGAAIGDGDIGVQALRVRAVENFIYLVVAQRGHGAMIISPQGRILAEATGRDGLAIADIDPRGGREGGDAGNWQRDMRARLFRERNPAAFSLLTDPRPPVLEKVPIAITREEAGRIMSRMLTVGEEEFKQAAALERSGKTREAIAAFEKLTNEYRGTWIDRASRERLAKRPPNQNRP